MRWLVFTTLFLLLASVALAAPQISVDPIDNQITPSKEAKFQLKVTNTGEEVRQYKIYALERGWLIDPKPADKTFALAKGQTKETTVTVRAIDDAFKPGAYGPTLYVDEYLGDTYTSYSRNLPVYLSPEQPKQYPASIKMDVDMVEKMDVKDTLLVKLSLENRFPRDLKGITLRLHGDLQNFNRELAVDIGPLEKKTIEVTVIPDPFAQPKEYSLFYVLEFQGQQITVVEKKLEILPSLPPFEQKPSFVTSYLKTFGALEIKNTGNVANTQNVRYPVSFWQSLFTFGEESTVKEGGQYYLQWKATLSPQEQGVFYFTTNYRVFLYLLLAVILLGLFYWYARSALLVSKRAVVTANDEDSLSEVKVTLEVKNVTPKALKNIVISDLVPGIANVEKSLELGTLKPEKVFRTTKGTRVEWNLAELDAFEHRLITYKIKTKLKVVGDFSLPSAQVAYVTAKNRKRKAYSRSVKLSA